MQTEFDITELAKKLERHEKILEDNNRLLRKLHRYELWGFWTRLVWYALLIGMPFALYFYVLQPYFEAMGSSYDTFEAGMREIPGWKQFDAMMQHFEERSQTQTQN